MVSLVSSLIPLVITGIEGIINISSLNILLILILSSLLVLFQSTSLASSNKNDIDSSTTNNPIRDDNKIRISDYEMSNTRTNITTTTTTKGLPSTYMITLSSRSVSNHEFREALRGYYTSVAPGNIIILASSLSLSSSLLLLLSSS